MKYLIIPDIHTKWEKAEKIIEGAGEYSKIIFLGDYFDEFNDTISSNAKTAHWLQESLKQENRIHLLGNHDLQYAFNCWFLKCTGFSPQKDAVINAILSDEDWNRMLYYYWLSENTLCSHAGLNPRFVTQEIKDNSFSICDWLQREERGAMHSLNRNVFHWFFAVGKSRGGNNSVGGLFWQCWSEFDNNILGINQIVGHTKKKNPACVFFSNFEKPPPPSYHLNLDTNLDFYGKFDAKSGNVSVHFSENHNILWKDF